MSEDPGDAMSDDRPDPALMAAQHVLHQATDEVNAFFEAQPTMAAAGLSGTVLSLADRSATLYWVGDVPTELAQVVDAAASRHGVTFTIKPARFTQDELEAATEQIWAETDGILMSSPESDGSGISVTIDLDVFADPSARRSTQPAVVEFVPGGGDGNYAAIQAQANARRSAALPAAAQLWAEFPADRDPRPLILLSPAFRVSGYRTGDAKEAGRRGYTIGAGIPQAAIDALRAAGLVAIAPGDDTGEITAAWLTTYPFMTDRGPQDLHAWKLRITHTLGPNYLLTNDERAREWVLPNSAERAGYSNGGATIGPDDRTLTYRFFGDSEEVSDVAEIEIVETAGSVAVFPRLQYRPGGWRHISMAMESRLITITLPNLLGGRVLVDDRGTPAIVTPD